eukprot:m.114299 g.114299  ORF g.114299 m.114299 type:complete len:474 (-) comp13048_c0_seq2:65-1486(-)
MLIDLAALLGAVCVGAPPVTFSYNVSNINSLSSNEVVKSGVASRWVQPLGHTGDLDGCATACIQWQSSNGTRCRSFTRYNEQYTANASLVGACFGHTDRAWVPLSVSGGMDSGEVEWPCESDFDCSFNGHCDVATGVCDCGKSGWAGRRCERLRLQPVDRSVLGFSPMENGRNMSSWGGAAVQVNGQWHLWASRLDNHCGIQSYLLNSRVVHAVSTSDSPLGPYEERESVVPPFAHEPDVVRAPTGEFVLISTAGSLGNYTGKQCQCTTGATSPPCGCDNSCHSFAPTISIATDPDGPWNTTLVWPGVDGENPAIWITKSGAVYAIGRGGKCVGYSTNWRNHSGWLHGPPPNVETYVSSQPDVEDPYIYQDENDHFHAIHHSLEGPHMCGSTVCQVGTHAFSLDGFAWEYGGTAYTSEVNFTDGSQIRLNRRERPHMVFAEGTRTIVALSNSAEVGGATGDRSFTLIQGVSTD